MIPEDHIADIDTSEIGASCEPARARRAGGRAARGALRGAPLSYMRNGWAPPEHGRLDRGGGTRAASRASSFASRLSQVASMHSLQ